MTFRDAINQLQDGYAAKRPSWSGYIEREAGTDGAHNLVLHYADGTTTVMYVFDSDGSNDIVKDGTEVKKGGAAAVPFVDYAPLTQFLLEQIIADDWEIDETSKYEAAMLGSNEF